MVRGSYCQQVMTFFFFFGLQHTARQKFQVQSETPLLKSLDLPLYCISKRKLRPEKGTQ